jgi:hypothetical protein
LFNPISNLVTCCGSDDISGTIRGLVLVSDALRSGTLGSWRRRQSDENFI